MMTISAIPVIDIGGLRSPDLANRKAVAAKIRQASHEVGFFYIANHGIAPALIEQIFAESRRFFALPIEQKAEISITHSPISRGYEPLQHQTLDFNAAPDLKESLYIGLHREADDPLVQAQTPNHGPNQYPRNLPGWRETVEQYFGQMLALSYRLMRGLALSLDLDEHHFDAMTDDPMPILRLLHYPPHPVNADDRTWGCGTHTDWGCLTILLQDASGGLEVQTASGDWIAAEPIPDTFVINIGDMIARWTNDYYQSTPHRVVNRSGGDRYSIPFFFDINYHALVECLPTCQSPENLPKYPPIKAGDHIFEMYRKTYV
ncbi:MAG: oxidoreductase [Cyanobacteria bacterium J069]|nr:MAG: isopenicillin N synthase family oxygenase [Cyanobacteria bacterium J069]